MSKTTTRGALPAGGPIQYRRGAGRTATRQLRAEAGFALADWVKDKPGERLVLMWAGVAPVVGFLTAWLRADVFLIATLLPAVPLLASAYLRDRGRALRAFPPPGLHTAWTAGIATYLGAWVAVLRVWGYGDVGRWFPVGFAVYVVTTTLVVVLWHSGGPGARALDKVKDGARWFDLLPILELGPDAERHVAVHGDRKVWTIDIGTEAGRLVDYYLRNRRIAKKIAQIEHTDLSRVRVVPGRRQGELVATIHRTDPWENAYPHPVLKGEPLAPRSILDAWSVGFAPDDEQEITCRLADLSDGGQHLLIVGKSGAGKSVLINGLMMHLAACTDATVRMIDLGKGSGVRAWAPVLADSATGRDADAYREAVRIMREITDEIGRRAEIPDKDDLPWIVLVIDELSALVGDSVTEHHHDQEVRMLALLARALLVDLVTRGRSERIVLVLASQRGLKGDLGSTTIPANVMTKILMRVGKRTEQTTILGAGWDADGVPPMYALDDSAKGKLVLVSDTGDSGFGRAWNLSTKDAEKAARALARSRDRQAHAEPEAGTGQARKPGTALAILGPVVSAQARTEPDHVQWGTAGWPVTGSTPEGHFWAAHRRLLRPELRGMVGQHEVSVPIRARFDFWVPGARLAVEIDGQAWHDEAKDCRRDEAFDAVGIETLRFTASEVMRDAEACVVNAAEAAGARLGDAGAPIRRRPLSGKAKATLDALRSLEPDEDGHLRVAVVHECVPGKGVGRVAAGEVVKELLEAGELIEVVNPDRQRPYAGRGRRFELPRRSRWAA